MSRAYYNEIDPYAAQWLRNLISAGHIAPGDVDERSIADVRGDDLRGYTQCHFFAGIGGWSIALRLAGWPDDRPVWTGSCPCQPFSAAGAGKAADDERHLWPAWFPLIAECRPAVVFGEQVEAAIGWGWLDAVFADLEGEGYACGATVLPACGLGAPHIRQRLWFVGHTDGAGLETQWSVGVGGSAKPEQLPDSSALSAVADSDGGDASAKGLQRSGEHGQRAQGGGPIVMGNADRAGWTLRTRLAGNDGAAHEQAAGQAAIEDGAVRGFWHDAEWIACTDGKARPVGPGSFPLGHGIQRRASKLRAYGNAIVPQVAAKFIEAADAAI